MLLWKKRVFTEETSVIMEMNSYAALPL